LSLAKDPFPVPALRGALAKPPGCRVHLCTAPSLCPRCQVLRPVSMCQTHRSQGWDRDSELCWGVLLKNHWTPLFQYSPASKKATLAPDPSQRFPRSGHWSFPARSCLATTHPSRCRLAGMTCSRDLSDLVKSSQRAQSYYRGTDGRLHARWVCRACPAALGNQAPTTTASLALEGTRDRRLSRAVRRAGVGLADGVCGRGAGNWAKICPGG